ncbi:MAG: T9SS type A sorting domain-containing protein [Bacteroidales bacterium]|nr:T9SS type A sorting domain-containing protein [Bacteroidales bacterium]
MKKYVYFSTFLMVLCVNLVAQVSFTNYTTADGLADDYVCGGVCVDNNNVWFGTQSGVSKFDGSTFTTFTTEDGLVENYINCIAYDSNNQKVWIGTENGVSVYDGSEFINYTTSEGLIDNSAKSICVDQNGVAWIATFSGLIKIDNGEVTNFTTTDGLPSDLLTRVRSNSDKLYIGSLVSGLIVYDGVSFSSYGTSEGLVDNYVSAIAVVDEGSIYIGSYAGVSVLNQSFSVTDTYTMESELFNNFVQDILVDDDGNIFVCEYADYLADGGVSMFNGSTWTTYTTQDGLVDVMLKDAAFDQNGNIWLTTGSGVSKMSLGAGSALLLDQSPVMIYPNPAKEYFVIYGANENCKYEVLDLSGRVVKEGSSVNQTIVNCDDLKQAVYIIKLHYGEKVYSHKISIK